MKIYAIIGEKTEAVDQSSKTRTPTGHIQMLGPRPSPEHIAQPDGTWAAPDYTINIWEAIKSLRTQKLAGGIPVEHEGQMRWFNSDANSRTQQQLLLGLNDKLPEGIQWKTLTNDFVTMTPELALALAAATVRHDDTIFAAAEQHRQVMLALDDPTDYDFSTCWPQTYQDVLDEAASVKAKQAALEQMTLFSANSDVPATIVEQGEFNSFADLQLALSEEKSRNDTLQKDMSEMKAMLAKLTARLE